MRILHLGKFYPPDYGGIETGTKLLCQAGVKLGHEVECWVSRRDRGTEVIEDVEGVSLRRIPSYGKLLSTPITPGFLKSPGILADVVHMHLPNPVVETAWRIRSDTSRARLIPFLHALPVSQGRLGSRWFETVTLPVLRKSEVILVSNAQFAKELARLDISAKLEVLPFFCARSPLTSGEALASVRESREGSRLVLALGRLVPYKGFDVLLRAWADAFRMMPAAHEFRLVIAGDGPERLHLKEMVRELALDRSVELRGAISEGEKDSLFREACLFVAPSTTNAETFGISILEAMNWALPVLTTRIPTGVAALAREGECGGVADPGDHLGLGRELQLLLASGASARSDIGERNLRFATETFSEEAFLSRYREILHGWDGEGR